MLGGTAWLWSREDAAGAVDVLFVDEAGQMSLANVLAVSQAADSLVLLGDPQQLDQPQKASHPDGVGVSALEHVLTAPRRCRRSGGSSCRRRGGCRRRSARSRPSCSTRASSSAKPGLERAAPARGRPPRRRWAVAACPVAHDGNQNASVEEVEAVGGSWSRTLLASGTRWVDEHGAAHALERHRPPRRRAVQRAGEPADRAAGAAGRAGRHGGQVPGPGGRRRHLLDDDLAGPRTRRAGWSSSTA